MIDVADIDRYMTTYSPQVLRYDKSTNVFGYAAINFGACKGETFDRVMIVPNGPLIKFITKGAVLVSPEKYYVAVTRPKYSIAIVMTGMPEMLLGYEEVSIDCSGTTIRALKYIPQN